MKSLLKGLTFLILLVVLLEIIMFIMIPNKSNFSKYGMWKKSEYEILGEKKDTIDIVFLGDSLIYSSISPMLLWNDYGYTSFDCAGPGQVIKDSYKYLKVAIDSQHPKLVIMEADVIFRDANSKFYKKTKNEQLKNYLPIEKFHNNWKKIVTLESYDTKWINYYKGYKYITKVLPVKKYNNYMKQTNKKIKIPEGNLDYLDKIIKLCDENDIEFKLVSIPSRGSWNYSKHVTIEKIAKEKNIEFTDLNLEDSINLDWRRDTKDSGRHTNYRGAKKITKFIGNYIHELDIVEDHRNDKKYDEWNIAYKKYIKAHAKYEAIAIQ